MTLAEGITRCNLDELIRLAQAERVAARKHGSVPSPACIELFRRAFAGDGDAWQALHTLLTPLVRYWVGAQRVVELEDVMQEAWSAFARYAPRHATLVAGDSLGPVLEFLRQCTITAVLTFVRKERRGLQTITGVDGEEFPDPDSLSDRADMHVALADRLQQLLTTDQERLVCTWRFEYRIKPQQIYQQHRDMFDDIHDVYRIIRNILARLRSDPVLRQLWSQAPVPD